MKRLIAGWLALIRFGFRLLYNEAAVTYDGVSWLASLGDWRCWIRSVLPHLAPPDAGNVLELAHGTGNLQVDLADAGYFAVGLDLSAGMGEIAWRKLERRSKIARLVRGRAQTLPFAAQQFKSVISTFPTDFIIDPATLQECHRVLMDTGVFVIVPNAILTGSGLLSRLIELLYQITGQRGSSISEADLQPLFAPYGFDVKVHEADCPRSRVTVIVARKSVKI